LSTVHGLDGIPVFDRNEIVAPPGGIAACRPLKLGSARSIEVKD
jgi:hypothetical protein